MNQIYARTGDNLLLQQVEALHTRYAHSLDDLDIDAWPGFFTDTASYQITTRENEAAGLPIGIIHCVNRGMMQDRVKAFHTANIFEPQSYNHLVGRAQLIAQDGDTCRARANFQVVRIMESGRMDLYAVGAYHDLIVRDGDELKFQERKVVLDSRRLDILLVIPL